MLIDVSAALMCFVSLTGIFLILLLKRYRTTGLAAAAIGAVASVLVYVYWVP